MKLAFLIDFKTYKIYLEIFIDFTNPKVRKIILKKGVSHKSTKSTC